MKFSLKYKFLMVLLGIPTITLFLYVNLVNKMFSEDKITYTMSALENNAASLGQVIEYQISKLKMLLDYNNDFDQIINEVKTNFLFIDMILVENGQNKKWQRKEKSSETDLFLKEIYKRIKNNEVKNNILIPLSEQVILWKLSYGRKSYYIVMDFYKLIEVAPKNKFFNLSFYNPSIKDIYSQDKSITKELQEKIEKLNNDNAQTFAHYSDKSLEAAYKTNFGLFVLSSIDTDKAMSALNELNEKTFYYFIFFIGVCGILSILVTNTLTKGLMDLFFATKKVASGDYDVDFKIETKDEVGQLSVSFITMSKTIKNLLLELKRYNEQLENMVRERTLELNQALSLQRAMIDSLDEGFFIFNQEGKVGEVTSKATGHIFQKEIKGESLKKLFELEETEESFSEFCSLVFSGVISPDDAIDLLPKSILTKNKKYLTMNYSAITGLDTTSDLLHNKLQESSTIENMVCVVADQTDKMIMQEQLNEDKDYINAILGIINNPDDFKKFSHSFNILIQKLKNSQTSDGVYRETHTFKAHANFIGLSFLTQKLHVLEDELKKIIENQKEYDHKTKSLVQELNDYFTKLSHRLAPFLENTKDGKGSSFIISNNALSELVKKLEKIFTDKKEKESLIVPLFLVSLKTLFKRYQDEIERLKQNSNQNIKLLLGGDDLLVYKPFYQNVFDDMIHLFKNSIVHGQNDENLIINIDIKIDDKIYIKYRDNGRGIDLKKIALKVNKKTKNDFELAQYILNDRVSTLDNTSIDAGRGVGLSALAASIVEIGGKIVIELPETGFGCLIELPIQKKSEIYARVSDCLS